MSNHIVLLGAEDVRSASNRMMEAATQMQHAASYMEGTAQRLLDGLAAITYRNEEMLRQLLAALEKRS